MSAKEIKAQILGNKPTLKPISISGVKAFVRDLTVGEVNYELAERRARLIKDALNLGIELEYNDPEKLNQQLQQVPDKYQLARGFANRVTDADGVLIFDPASESDLKAINELPQSVWDQINKAGRTVEQEIELKN